MSVDNHYNRSVGLELNDKFLYIPFISPPQSHYQSQLLNLNEAHTSDDVTNVNMYILIITRFIPKHTFQPPLISSSLGSQPQASLNCC